MGNAEKDFSVVIQSKRGGEYGEAPDLREREKQNADVGEKTEGQGKAAEE